MRADGVWSSTFELQAKTVLISPSGERRWSFGAEAGAARDTSMPHGGPAFQTYFGRALASLYPTNAVEIDLDLGLGLANAYGSGTYALAGAALQYLVIERAQLLAEVFKDEPGRGGAQVGMSLPRDPESLRDVRELRPAPWLRPGQRLATIGIRLQTDPFLP